MQTDRHKRLYALHSWIGVIAGLLIYIVSFSGTVALFSKEITSWEDPAQRIDLAQTPPALNPALTRFQENYQNLGQLDYLHITTPSPETPIYTVYATFKKHGLKTATLEEKWHGETAEPLPHRGHGLSIWIRDFHRMLMLPKTLGRTLVGISGLLLMLLIISGILIHGKVIREFFTLRLNRSIRLKWRDSHKVLGIFGLPFSTMIAFTGAFLGVVGILAPIIAFLAFQGDTESLINKIAGDRVELSGESANMVTLDALYAHMHPTTGARPAIISARNYGDKNTQFLLEYKDQTRLNRYEEIYIWGATGALVHPDSELKPITPANRLSLALTPLHYATYGTISLKWMYAGLGLVLSLLVATGLILWIERRSHGSEGNKSKQFYSRISRLNIGVTLGFPLATATIFIFDKLYSGPESERLFFTGVTYFTTISAALIVAQFQANSYRSIRFFITLLSSLMFAIPLVNMLTTDARFWISGNVGTDYSNGVDISALILAVICLWVAAQLPTQRSKEKEKRLRRTATVSIE